jgi:alpha-galactosidase
VWVYPQPEFQQDEFDLSIVNGLLARPQLSGGIWKLSSEQLDRLAQAVRTYKGYRHELPTALPCWPIGLPAWNDDWLAYGLVAQRHTFISVWRRGGDDTAVLSRLQRGIVSVLFPTECDVTTRWTPEGLVVELPRAPSAVLLKIS